MIKKLFNNFYIYSKSQTRQIFATLKKLLQENFTPWFYRLPEHRRDGNVPVCDAAVTLM